MKASFPILFTLSGIVRLSRLLQKLNTLSLISVTFLEIVTVLRLLHAENA